MNLYFLLVALSFLSSWCSGYQIVSGQGLVYASNYSYYLYESSNRLRIILTSLKGDADLYIAKNRDKPTVDLDTHHLQSVSCGIDIVDVPENFGTELTIGVYGHPSYEYSVFHLDIINYSEGEDITPHENGSIDLGNKFEIERMVKMIEDSAFNDNAQQEALGREEDEELEDETIFQSFLQYLLNFIVIIIEIISQ